MLDNTVDGVEVLRGRVRDEWIDVNDHVNVAGYLAAFDLAVLHLVSTAESMTLHVDLERRRVVPWPDTVLDRLQEFAAQQRGSARPQQAGRGIEIRNPIYTME